MFEHELLEEIGRLTMRCRALRRKVAALEDPDETEFEDEEPVNVGDGQCAFCDATFSEAVELSEHMLAEVAKRDKRRRLDRQDGRELVKLRDRVAQLERDKQLLEDRVSDLRIEINQIPYVNDQEVIVKEGVELTSKPMRCVRCSNLRPGGGDLLCAGCTFNADLINFLERALAVAEARAEKGETEARTQGSRLLMVCAKAEEASADLVKLSNELQAAALGAGARSYTGRFEQELKAIADRFRPHNEDAKVTP